MVWFLAVLLFCQIAVAQNNPRPNAVSKYIPGNASDVSFVVSSDSQSKVTLAAWSQPGRNEPGFDSGAIAVRETGQHTKVVWRLKLPGAYSPKLFDKSEFTYRGRPIVLLQMQFGAAAAEMRVMGVNGDRVAELGSIEADDFEFTTLKGATYLVAHEDANLLDVPRLYRWTGAGFVDDSANHPEFYRQLANHIRSESDVTKLAKPVQLRFAQIVLLSGEQSGASNR